jgi:hypothetical protein
MQKTTTKSTWRERVSNRLHWLPKGFTENTWNFKPILIYYFQNRLDCCRPKKRVAFESWLY